MAAPQPAPGASTATKNNVPPNAKPLVPPEEQFWQRYSPHHEAPLSGIGSFALHFLIAGFLLVAGYLGWLSLGNRHSALPTDVVSLDRPGGGGRKTGSGNDPNDGGQPKEVADLAQPDPNKTPPPADATQRPDLAPSTPDTPLPPPESSKEANERIVRDAKSNLQKLEGLNKDLQDRLRLREGAGPAPQGQGGPGSGGGKGTGKGPGEGVGMGEGRGTLSSREKRMLRWTMQFDTRSGQDYLRQLRGLGAILAIPKDRAGKDYYVIRDLGSRPPALLDEDVATIQRIFWIDDKPQSVASIMRALGLNLQPDRFVAFMPEELEQKLFDLELRYRGLKEDDIEETIFQVRLVRDKYVPIVVRQTEKR
jgi:hypothetical protein